MKPETEYRGRAWLMVGLLWLVGCLNYIDRMMIMTMRSSLVEAIPMSDVQFGLLTTLFLWVYAAFSPLAGYLADRLNRSMVIVVSFMVWSIVTWLTAYSKTYEQLLATRALMGISEACYIPAALALISDYHRTTTRSIANGIHMTGLMVGSAMGGLGGMMAEHHDWSYAFKFFGIIGIAVALVLMFFLRDRPGARTASAETGEPRVRLLDGLRILLGNKAFLMTLAYWGSLAVCVWSVVGWMPTYLKEQFHLSQSEAGMSATAYLQVASLAGVLIGGAWADRWSRSHPRGPLFVVMIGLIVAAPCIIITSLANALWVALAGIVFFGLTKAFTDANMMPILTLIVDKRYRATGYGILNLSACTVGGLANLLGGFLRDANVSVSLVFQIGGACCFLSFLILAFLKPAAQRQ